MVMTSLQTGDHMLIDVAAGDCQNKISVNELLRPLLVVGDNLLPREFAMRDKLDAEIKCLCLARVSFWQNFFLAPFQNHCVRNIDFPLYSLLQTVGKESRRIRKVRRTKPMARQGAIIKCCF